ncbi:hypothetical protein FIBSPDRAFT_892292 [Athelia psychrophila]|uniref:Uncharacterized protein n=1 Tax=Athelia psychrophila TaxID=1759441 RepID=A0A166IJR5_9AGAM|nr:hypothetical protein FIBSPDRAFT_892292 [Fibularhizoctonia sp. CBS 109695]
MAKVRLKICDPVVPWHSFIKGKCSKYHFPSSTHSWRPLQLQAIAKPSQAVAALAAAMQWQMEKRNEQWWKMQPHRKNRKNLLTRTHSQVSRATHYLRSTQRAHIGLVHMGLAGVCRSGGWARDRPAGAHGTGLGTRWSSEWARERRVHIGAVGAMGTAGVMGLVGTRGSGGSTWDQQARVGAVSGQGSGGYARERRVCKGAAGVHGTDRHAWERRVQMGLAGACGNGEWARERRVCKGVAVHMGVAGVHGTGRHHEAA